MLLLLLLLATAVGVGLKIGSVQTRVPLLFGLNRIQGCRKRGDGGRVIWFVRFIQRRDCDAIASAAAAAAAA